MLDALAQTTHYTLELYDSFGRLSLGKEYKNKNVAEVIKNILPK